MYVYLYNEDETTFVAITSGPASGFVQLTLWVQVLKYHIPTPELLVLQFQLLLRLLGAWGLGLRHSELRGSGLGIWCIRLENNELLGVKDKGVADVVSFRSPRILSIYTIQST